MPEISTLTSFAFCSNLKKIRIPDGVQHIPSNAFMGCVALQEIELPDSVLSIGSNAFFIV